MKNIALSFGSLNVSDMHPTPLPAGVTGQASLRVYDARDAPSGVYYYVLRAGSFVSTQRMTLVK